MLHRIPLVATVVGALFIGGATTGTTLALWHDQESLAAGALQSGNLIIDVRKPGEVIAQLGSLSLVPGEAKAIPATVLNSSQTGAKNLRMNIRFLGATVTGDPSTPAADTAANNLELNVAPRGSSGSCVPASAGYTPLATPNVDPLNATPLGYEQLDLCVSMRATSGEGTDGVVTLTFEAVQSR